MTQIRSLSIGPEEDPGSVGPEGELGSRALVDVGRPALRRWLGRRFALLSAGCLALGAAAFPIISNLPGGPGARAATTAAASPGNLLSGDQTSFTTSTGRWVGVSATLSWVSSAGDSAPGALGVTATGSQGMSAESGSPSGGLVPATAGLAYAGSVATEAPTTAQEVEPLLVFYNSAGNLLTAVFGPETQTVTGAWAQATPVSAIAPADTASAALELEVPSTTTGDEVYLDDAWIDATPDDVPAVAGPLHTSGNQIIDANGSPLILRGVVLDGLESSSTAPGVTQEAVMAAKAWGTNFIRLPLGEQFWVSSNCDYDPNYSARVAQVVNWITSLGMVVLLDLHWNTVGGCESGEQHDMADEEQAPEFWSQVATQFGSNPLVAFDLYNEPHNISDSVWLNGGTITDFYSPNQTYEAAGMQQLYDVVRATGAQNLVFISGNNWANTVPSTLVSGTNIVYAVHDYTCPVSAPPDCSDSSPYDPSPIIDNWIATSASVPVMVTEFGWPSPYDGTYNANVIALAQEHAWGWSAFDWEQLEYPSAWDLTAEYLNDGTAEPAPSGMAVLCALAAASSGAQLCAPPVSVTTTTTSTTPTTTPGTTPTTTPGTTPTTTPGTTPTTTPGTTPTTTPGTTPTSSPQGACASYTGNDAFLCSAYEDLLDRLPDAAGLATFGSALAGGTSRVQVARDVTASAEYRDDLVDSYYSGFLGRPADPGGLSSWVGQIQSGATDRSVQAAILGSSEYYADSGATSAGFVSALYGDLLGRVPDAAGLSYWEAQLGAGASRSAVAGAILGSSEYLGDFVGAQYVNLLNRAADPGGLSSWVSHLASGGTYEDVICGIVGSNEFYSDSTS